MVMPPLQVNAVCHDTGISDISDIFLWKIKPSALMCVSSWSEGKKKSSCLWRIARKRALSDFKYSESITIYWYLCSSVIVSDSKYNIILIFSLTLTNRTISLTLHNNRILSDAVKRVSKASETQDTQRYNVSQKSIMMKFCRAAEMPWLQMHFFLFPTNRKSCRHWNSCHNNRNVTFLLDRAALVLLHARGGWDDRYSMGCDLQPHPKHH